MMFEPGERQTTVGEQRERIRGVLAKDNQVIFVAEGDGQMLGYVAGLGGTYKRNKHCAHVVIGVLQAFTGQGLGARLLTQLVQWAGEKGIHRLELTVMAQNERAIGLYTKMGFETEGVCRHALWVGGKYVDEHYMARLL